METTEININLITSLRKETDVCINSISLLDKSAEVTLAMRELQRAKMWLGVLLSALGRTNPYPESDNPTSPKIEPQADHSNETVADRMGWKDCTDNVSKVKYLRNLIEELWHMCNKDVVEKYNFGDTPAKHFALKSWMSLKEAKLWLGMDLDRMRNSQEKQVSKTTTQDWTFDVNQVKIVTIHPEYAGLSKAGKQVLFDSISEFMKKSINETNQ